MDKKVIAKTGMFFSGIVSRMEENREYFREIKINMKSGTKNFQARVFYEEDTLYFSFNAVKREISPEELWQIISDEMKNYDEAVTEYAERGICITIISDRKQVKLRQTDKNENLVKNTYAAVNSERSYVVNPAIAGEMLGEIGILAQNGKIKNDKIRKYNQIDYFVELTADIIKDFDENRELIIIDCACGKSYLSFVLNFYLREIRKRKCRFICIDYSETVINASKAIAEKLGYKNMEFIKQDLTAYVPEAKPDIVISLHACDTATDMALGLGIRSGSRAIICVPCCHKDILKQYSYEPFRAITKYGILKARLADTLTDGLRGVYLESCGYNVSMIEYISPLETPKNIMLRCIYTGKKSLRAKDEYDNLKDILGVSPAIEKYAEPEKMPKDISAGAQFKV